MLNNCFTQGEWAGGRAGGGGVSGCGGSEKRGGGRGDIFFLQCDQLLRACSEWAGFFLGVGDRESGVRWAAMGRVVQDAWARKLHQK